MLDQIEDWQLVADLEKKLKFPDIVPTNQGPDLVILVNKDDLIVSLYGVYRPTRAFFTHIFITGEVLQILTYARHLCPLSSEGSLACHTYCDTGHPFIMVISEDP